MAEELVVPEVLAGERIDRAVATLTGWTRREVQDLVAGGEILLDGARVSKSHKLVGGEVVELLADPPSPGLPTADADIPIAVRYEDDDVFVVAKPPGLVVHPGAGHPDGTLVNGLLALDPAIAATGDPQRPGIVHRLDRDTSGLLVVARTPRAYEALVGALAEHEVTRQYLALVWGRLESPRGVIDAPIGRSVRRPTRMAVREGGRRARTEYEVVTEFTAPEVSLVRASLETGRTHQIRVHLQAIGHPVVGDAVYGGARPGLDATRPFLHATTLAFAHPVTGEPVRVEEPLPADLTDVLARLA